MEIENQHPFQIDLGHLMAFNPHHQFPSIPPSRLLLLRIWTPDHSLQLAILSLFFELHSLVGRWKTVVCSDFSFLNFSCSVCLNEVEEHLCGVVWLWDVILCTFPCSVFLNFGDEDGPGVWVFPSMVGIDSGQMTVNKP